MDRLRDAVAQLDLQRARARLDSVLSGMELNVVVELSARVLASQRRYFVRRYPMLAAVVPSDRNAEVALTTMPSRKSPPGTSGLFAAYLEFALARAAPSKPEALNHLSRSMVQAIMARATEAWASDDAAAYARWKKWASGAAPPPAPSAAGPAYLIESPTARRVLRGQWDTLCRWLGDPGA